MDYTHLQDLRNRYPADVVPNSSVSSFYEKKEGYVRRYGIDTKNTYIDIDTYPLDKLKTLDPTLYPYVDFQFIIQFYDEDAGFMEEWTSAPFKKLLELAVKENNPYFNKFTVPIIPLNYGELKDYHRTNQFAIAEKYVETDVTKTIATIEEMIIHIQWLSVFTDQFRNTQVGNIINDTKYPIDGIGSWTTYHKKGSDLGFGWYDYFKKTTTDKVFANDITEGLVPDIIEKSKPSDEAFPIQPPVTTTPIVIPPPINNNPPVSGGGGGGGGGVYYPPNYNDGYMGGYSPNVNYYNR